MYIKRLLVTCLVLCGLILVIAITFRLVEPVRALSFASDSNSANLIIPYSGQLTDETGQPVMDGPYDFTFALYNTETEGTLLWSDIQPGVIVKNGTFATALGTGVPLPADVVKEGERWLAVAIRGPAETDFTTLTPRQQLSSVLPSIQASPLAQSTCCPHIHWGETWEGSGIGLTLKDTTNNNTATIPAVLAAVFGSSETWAGVWGKSTSNIGVLGESTNARGVTGHSVNDFGGFFYSDNDHSDLALGGAVGRINSDSSDQNSQLYLSSNADVIIKLDNDGGENHTLRVLNSGGTNVCTVDESGNLSCIGAKNAVVQTESYGWRRLNAVESPGVWFEDFGTATLVAGKATVIFDPIFAETVNPEVAYHVFMTPLGSQPVLLTVSHKDSQGFIVQGVTLADEPATCDFDYRIVVKRLGYEEIGLDEITWPEGQ